MDPVEKPQDPASPAVVVPPVTAPAEAKPDPEPVKPDPAVEATKAELDAAKAELAKLQKEKSDREATSLSETEREKKRADDNEATALANENRLRRVSIIQAVRDSAPGLKVELDVEAVRDLYEAGAFKGIKLDDKGEPIGVADMVKGLVTSKPYIVKKATVAAPDINADKSGDQKAGELSDAEKASIAKRFRIKK